MSWHPLILIEIVLVFGTVCAWGLWELRTLRKLRQQREERQQREAAEAARRDAAS